MLSSLLAMTAAAATFYVAPNGNDAWRGVAALPQRTDGPFATLGRALDAARAFRADHRNPTAPVRLEVEGGVYKPYGKVVIRPEDSGTPSSPTIIEAWGRGKPIFSGGQNVPLHQDGDLWVGDGYQVDQLYVNGMRRPCSRWPKNGYSLIDRTVPSTADLGSKGFNRFGFRMGDIKPEWAGTRAQILIFHVWTMDRMPIASVDSESQTVTLAGHTLPASYSSLDKGSRYIVENVPNPGPGEWYVDRFGKLIYNPGSAPDGKYKEKCLVSSASCLANTKPIDNPAGTLPAIVPRLPVILSLEGDIEHHLWVHDVQIKGIGFEYSNYQLPQDGHAFPQADLDVGAAIEAIGARDCRFENLTIRHTGGWAMAFHSGCRSDVLENSDLEDLGAGGVKVGETSMPKDAELTVSHIDVRNCRIEHGGRYHPAATGAWIGQSAGDSITHNTIADFYYTGISVGWSWGYGKSLTQNITVADNDIHDIGQEVLSDMGGIYTLGLEPGTVLRHNRIADVNGFYYGGWGIYFDEGTSNIAATNNLVVNCKTGCFHQHYGANNLVENNIFDGAKETGLIIRTRAEDHLSLTFEHNIAVADGVPLLASNWNGNGYLFKDNLYWDPHPGPSDFGGKTWDAWRAAGNDKGSLFADPQFGKDYKLRPDSPAFKIGFKPFRLNQFGSTLSPSLPPQPPAFPVFRRGELPETIQ